MTEYFSNFNTLLNAYVSSCFLMIIWDKEMNDILLIFVLKKYLQIFWLINALLH